MTRKEQIIIILDKYGLIDENYPEVTDAILALPIEVPSEEEIKSYVQSQCRYGYSSQEAISIVCVKWAINEILKRNGNLSL